MTNLDSVWANTQAEGNAEKNPPPAGTVGILRISGQRAGTSKKGEQYFAIDCVDDTLGYSFAIYKQFTNNGQPAEGKIKAAKITLRQLGIEVASPAQLQSVLPTIVGRFYAYEAVASKDLNPTTGYPYVNTNITGVASAPNLPAQPVAAPAPVAPAPQVQAPTQVATPQGVAQFPSALPPQPGAPAAQYTQPQAPAAVMQQQVQAAQAAAQNEVTWDYGPQGVAPSPVQQG